MSTKKSKTAGAKKSKAAKTKPKLAVFAGEAPANDHHLENLEVSTIVDADRNGP